MKLRKVEVKKTIGKGERQGERKPPVLKTRRKDWKKKSGSEVGEVVQEKKKWLRSRRSRSGAREAAQNSEVGEAVHK